MLVMPESPSVSIMGGDQGDVDLEFVTDVSMHYRCEGMPPGVHIRFRLGKPAGPNPTSIVVNLWGADVIQAFNDMLQQARRDLSALIVSEGLKDA